MIIFTLSQEGALAWFDGLLYADEPDNLPLCEEVMALGKFGYLTLIYHADRS